jgi:hypothetical protein
MASQDIKEWLKTIVWKAAAASFKEEPEDVIIRRSDIAALSGAHFKPTHEVWARVILAKVSYEVLVNVEEDGSYSGFRIVG